MPEYEAPPAPAAVAAVRSVGSAAGDTAAADKVTITELTQTLVNGKQYISGVTPNTDLAAAKITACPNNAWTKTVGATAVDQCSEYMELQAVLSAGRSLQHLGPYTDENLCGAAQQFPPFPGDIAP